MPRVIGIDPGTVSIDLCGLEDGTVFLDRSFPTAAALSDPDAFLAVLTDAGPIDLIAGPSGYGLPLTRAREATEEDLRLAFLAAEGETGGIGGLRALVRALAPGCRWCSRPASSISRAFPSTARSTAWTWERPTKSVSRRSPSPRTPSAPRARSTRC